ncbi:NAD(P)-binding protein [Apiospora phragmitis]|uniref:NAD(P)-binding protein n=1 Tax=Apiospora phragmitis TaxID=2905665 RepID=A0ABR1WQZ9_9PEZI
MAYKSTILITGGTSGLGYHAALDIARACPDAQVIISSRSDREQAAASIHKALKQSNVVYAALDLGDLANVRAYAEEFAAARHPPIRALLLNAGLQFPGEAKTTVDGLEATFGINHVGHALLFHLLAPFLADNARVVITSSGTHDPEQFSGLLPAIYTSAEALAHPTPAFAASQGGRQRYTSSKLCNVLWCYALGRRLSSEPRRRGIMVTVMCPGFMPGTGLAREASAAARFLFLKVMPYTMPLLRALLRTSNIHSPAESGAALARLAVGDDDGVRGVTGKYFEGRREIQSSKDSYDVEKQEDLWRWTVGFLSGGDEEVRRRFEEVR